MCFVYFFFLFANFNLTLCALHVLKSCCGTASQMPAQCQPNACPMPAYRRPLRSFCFTFFSGAENKLKSENVPFIFFCAPLHLLRPLLLAFSSIRSQARVRFSFQFLPSSSSSCWLSLSLLSLVLFHTARATLTMSEDDEKSAIYKRCSWTQAEEKCR